MALWNKLRDKVDTLVSHDSIEKKKSQAAIWEACYVGDLKRVRKLVAEGSSPALAQRTGRRFTPLHNAARGGHIRVVQFLLSQSVSLRKKDQFGYDAMQLALQRGNTGVVEILQQAKDLRCSNEDRSKTVE